MMRAVNKMELLKYKGVFGSARVDVAGDKLFGYIQFQDKKIGSWVIDYSYYSANTPNELNKNFQTVVDSYLAECIERNVEPTTCVGKFNVRVGHELHLAAAVAAKEADISLNEYIKCLMSVALNIEYTPLDPDSRRIRKAMNKLDIPVSF